MPTTIEPLLHIHKTIRSDVADYHKQVARFREGELSAMAFKAYRVPMGIYEQRTADTYMVRVRLGAGLLLPEQAHAMARISRQYADGMLHLTTRQDIQIHNVTLENTIHILNALLEAGLSARGGGGNTVRNIGVSPRANVSPDAVFDVNPYAIALNEYLLQSATSFSMPRKLKIAFSAHAEDTAYASVTDLGFFAQVKDGKRGFRAYVAGGLGGGPRVGILLEEWVDEDDIYLVAESVKQLFDEVGDRVHRHKARLRHALRRLGEVAFMDQYQAIRARLAAEGLPYPVPAVRDIQLARPSATEADSRTEVPAHLTAEDTPGLYSLEIAPTQGLLTADALDALAEIAEGDGLPLLQATQQQSLYLLSLPGLKAVAAIQSLQTKIPSLKNDPVTVVACAGASTCKLGLCLSRELAGAIHEEIARAQVHIPADAPEVRISGCPNSCANHSVATIGLHGKAKKYEGRWIPYYEVLSGAQLRDGESRLGQRRGAIPARAVPAFYVLMIQQRAWESIEKLGALITDFQTLPDPLPEEWFRDWGEAVDFNLDGRSAGECSTSAIDVVQAEIDDAKEIFAQEELSGSALYAGWMHLARALLPLFEIDATSDTEAIAAFAKHLAVPGWVPPRTVEDLATLQAFREKRLDCITNLVAPGRDLLARIVALKESLDARLDFTLDPYDL